MNIEMKRVRDFPNFNARAFFVEPSYWWYSFIQDDNQVEKARELAKDIEDICIAIVHDENGEYVLGEIDINGCAKFKLFNAEISVTKGGYGIMTITSKEEKSYSRFFSLWVELKKGGIV